MLANVSLSSTFDDLPGLRDLLLSQRSERLHVEPWQDRSDVAVFARDATDERRSNPTVRSEIASTVRLGTPVFVLGRLPWPELRGRCVPIDRDEHDRVSCLRLLDSIEDHLFHQDLDTGPLPGPDDLGEWLRQDLWAAGLLDGPERRAREARSGPPPAGPSGHYEDLLRDLRRGEYEAAVDTLLKPDGSPVGGWPAGYVLGRIRGARSWFEELAPSSEGEGPRSASEVLDAAYWDLRGDRPLPEMDAAAAQACLVALVRINRRFAPSRTQQWLTRLDHHLGRPTGAERTPIDVEQVRLDGRQGPERIESVVAGLTVLLWRSPELAERLLLSQDLTSVHALAAPRLVDAVRRATVQAAQVVVQPAPAVPGDSLQDAVEAARSFARACASSVRRDLLALDGLTDQRSHPGRLTVEVRADELVRCRDDRRAAKDARDQAAVDLAARAREAGLPPELADPLNLPRPALEPASGPGPHDEPDAALAALTAELDLRLERAVQERDASQDAYDRMVRQAVPPPERPAGRRAVVGSVAALVVVLLVVAAVVFRGHAGLLVILALLSALVVVGCFGTWGLRTRHHRRLARAEAVLASARGRHRVTSAAHAAAVAVRTRDDELVASGQAERRAADRYVAATVRRDQVAHQLGLGESCTATGFAEAVRDRLVAFDRAFAEQPRFWWSEAVTARPARERDLISVGETSPVRGGLLAGTPGARLVRAVDVGGRRVVSDVWAVFGPQERDTALLLEQRLEAWRRGRAG